jgi:nicotinamidase-related amidase
MDNVQFDYQLDDKGPRGIAPSSWLDRDSLALVVIDVQNYITLPRYSGTWTAAEGGQYYYSRIQETVLPNIQRLTTRCHELDILICYTRIASTTDDLSDVPGITRKILAEELLDCNGNVYHLFEHEHASQIDGRLVLGPDDLIILKTASGSICSSTMEEELRERGKTRLIFTGGLTDACVSSSVRQAYDRGFLCTLVEDACITTSPTDHGAAVRALGKFYAWVTNTDHLLSLLT